jgi:hypothetical protein
VAVAGGASHPPTPLLAIDWKGFEAYLLQRCNKKTTGDRLRYARRYGSVILGNVDNNNNNNNNNISDILQLSGEKRLHVMKTLSSLAKYTGQYDRWLQLRQRYNLKWANENANLQSFERFFNEGLNYDTMLQRIKEMIAKTLYKWPNYQILPTYWAPSQGSCGKCKAA